MCFPAVFETFHFCALGFGCHLQAEVERQVQQFWCQQSSFMSVFYVMWVAFRTMFTTSFGWAKRLHTKRHGGDLTSHHNLTAIVCLSIGGVWLQKPQGQDCSLTPVPTFRIWVSNFSWCLGSNSPFALCSCCPSLSLQPWFLTECQGLQVTFLILVIILVLMQTLLSWSFILHRHRAQGGPCVIHHGWGLLSFSLLLISRSSFCVEAEHSLPQRSSWTRYGRHSGGDPQKSRHSTD